MSDKDGRTTSRQRIRAEIEAQFPHLAAKRARKTSPAGTVPDPAAIVLGRNQLSVPVQLPVRPRLEHAHVIGTTGGGKSNLLQHMIRQDIALGRGVCVVDPHGNHHDSLYRSLLTWLEEKGFTKTRTIHLIDPNAPSHTVGFNPLQRPDNEIDLSVIAGTTLEAFEQVWGEDSQSKPTIRRVLLATFTALAELGLTLAEADLLFDPHDELGIRQLVAEKLHDRFARRVFRRLHQLAIDDRSKREFNAEVVGPENRLAEFIRSSAVRYILGQSRNTLDLRAAMDEGHIVLVNLAGGSRVYEADAELLGRLITRFLFFHAVRRRHPERPFFFYLDECQRYLSGDVERLLGEVRKFGVGCVLSHQWQQQLVRQGDETILEAVQNATNLKAVFRVKSVKEAGELAEAVIPLNLEMPVQALIKPTVVAHKRTLFRGSATAEHHAHVSAVAEAYGETDSDGESDTDMAGVGDLMTSGSMSGQNAASAMTMSGDAGWAALPDVITLSAGQTSALSSARAKSANSSSAHSRNRASARSWSKANIESDTHGTSRAESTSEGLEPVYADLPSAVHSKEDALYFASLTLRSLKTGQAFVNYVGAEGMVSALLSVPKVQPFTMAEKEFADLRTRVLAASPSATQSAEAAREIAEREQQLIAEAKSPLLLAPVPKEPTTFRVAAPIVDPPEEPATFRVPSPRRPKPKK